LASLANGEIRGIAGVVVAVSTYNRYNSTKNWKAFERDPRLRALPELSDDEMVVGWLHPGYPDGATAPTQRSPAHTRLTILDQVRGR
jgi:hypothetical protein